VKLGTTLYAATHLGVYVSTDDGASFVRWGSGMPLVNVWEINFSNPSLVRAATYGRGFWEIIP
jgi:fructose 1,6-bisphosphatase